MKEGSLDLRFNAIEPRLIFLHMMTMPPPFGWRIPWIAVVASAEARVLEDELQLIDLRPCDWHTGLQEAHSQGIFITPNVSGWILVVGIKLPDASNESTLPLIVRLSEICGEAQYFGNHPIPDYYAWARAKSGRLVRAYAYLGEQGVTFWDRGELTPEEKGLGLAFEDFATPNLSDKTVEETLRYLKENPRRYPGEADVFGIAAKWSVDPTRIEEYQIADCSGALGYFESQGTNREEVMRRH